jgi:hypothetical protein
MPEVVQEIIKQPSAPADAPEPELVTPGQRTPRYHCVYALDGESPVLKQFPGELSMFAFGRTLLEAPERPDAFVFFFFGIPCFLTAGPDFNLVMPDNSVKALDGGELLGEAGPGLQLQENNFLGEPPLAGESKFPAPDRDDDSFITAVPDSTESDDEGDVAGAGVPVEP